MHLHLALASPCSVLSLEALFEAAERRGLDGVCISDHESYGGYEAALRMAKDLEIRVFMGVEIRSAEGDVLVYSQEKLDMAEIRKREIEYGGGSRPSAQRVIDFANERGDLAVVAHPYRTTAPSLSDSLYQVYNLWGVEVYNGNCSKGENEMALSSARELGLRCTAGSDAHWVGAVGAYYTEFEASFDTQEEFIAALRSGNFEPRGSGVALEGY